MLPSPSPISTVGPSHWDPLLIVVAGFIFFMLLLFMFCRILKRYCRNRIHSRRIYGDTIPDDLSFGFQSPGLNFFPLDSMPVTQFSSKDEVDLSRGDIVRDCAICLGEFEEGEWLKHLPGCSHVFHVSCIDTWFQTHPSCPICRSFFGHRGMIRHQNSISMYRPFVDTLRRTAFHQERLEQYQSLRSYILHNSPQQRETRVPIRDVF